ncbi:hypothetical protein HDV02_005190 [Globomyces sp. JEL0801]|nr:hypothetical protein HDV02_005190 [Globomyces sp. JEL0801]
MSIVVEYDTFPIQRCNVKTTPAMTMKAITVNACQSLKIANPDGYQLVYKKQSLQPSLAFRLANIPHGAKLSLVINKTANEIQNVSIALQTEDAGRLIDTFLSTTTLWSILLHFETKGSLNLVRKTGQGNKKNLFSKTPTVYMMPFKTIEKLQTTTLGEMGLTSGTGSIRLLYQVTDASIDQYMDQINKPIAAAVSKQPSIVEGSSKTPVNTSTPIQTINKSNPPPAIPTENVNMRDSIVKAEVGPMTRPESAAVENIIQEPAIDAGIRYYRPPVGGPGPQSSISYISHLLVNLPDSFFRLTSAELKSIFDSQNKARDNLENRPLMTQAMRDKEAQLKQQKSPPKLLLDPSKTFWNHGLAPATIVYFQCDSKGPWLSEKFLQTIEDFPVMNVGEVEEVSEELVEDEEVEQSGSQTISTKLPEPKKPNTKVPKWFKLK